MSIQKLFFGNLPDGRAVYRYVMQNASGMTVAILNFGGAIQQILVPDNCGRFTDVVGGYDSRFSYASLLQRNMKAAQGGLDKVFKQ